MPAVSMVTYSSPFSFNGKVSFLYTPHVASCSVLDQDLYKGIKRNELKKCSIVLWRNYTWVLNNKNKKPFSFWLCSFTMPFLITKVHVQVFPGCCIRNMLQAILWQLLQSESSLLLLSPQIKIPLLDIYIPLKA